MAENMWMPCPSISLLQATRLSEAYKTDPAMASSAASGNPKRAGLFRRALVQCHLLYYHWEILTAIYMLDFWEKSLVNTLCILGMALVTYGLTDGVQRLVAWVGTDAGGVGR